MTTKRTPSIIEVAVSNLGVVRGSNVALDVAFWVLAVQRPEWADARTIEEKAEVFANVSARHRRSAMRRLVAARKAFPGHEPWDLALSIVSEIERKKVDHDQVGLLPYPVGVA